MQISLIEFQAHSKILSLRQQVIKASEPMRQHQKDVSQVDDPPRVRPDRAALDDVVKLQSSMQLDRERKSD